MICVFDIETIPDVQLIKKLHDFQGSDIEISKQAMDDQKQKTSSSFLPIIYHQIVAICAVIADDFGNFVRVNSLKGENEEDYIRAFLGFLDKFNPKLISFNGRNFDLPTLMMRSMKYNLSCKAYYETNNYELSKNKWDHYRYRYNERFHVDLLDCMSEFGAVRGLKLDSICSMLNIPGKYDVHGDQVMELYYANEHEKIRAYCESDVLNTYWLFLKYELLRGNLSLKDYASYLSNMSEKMPKTREYNEVFASFIHEELQRIKLD